MNKGKYTYDYYYDKQDNQIAVIRYSKESDDEYDTFDKISQIYHLLLEEETIVKELLFPLNIEYLLEVKEIELNNAIDVELENNKKGIDNELLLRSLFSFRDFISNINTFIPRAV